MDIIDLHIHTECSDGGLRISDISRFALENNIKVLSVTDHDTVDAYSYLYSEYSDDMPYRLIPGIEVTAEHNNRTIHLLGYGMKLQSEEFNRLIRHIKMSFAAQMTMVLMELRKKGIIIENEKQWLFKGLDKLSVHLVEKGFYGNADDFFYNIMYRDGKRIFKRKKPKSWDVIEAINKSGGFVSLAHPARISSDLSKTEKIIAELKKFGLSALECFHPMQKKTYNEYISIAAKYNLLITGGSDFHGADSVEYTKDKKRLKYNYKNLVEKNPSLTDLNVVYINI